MRCLLISPPPDSGVRWRKSTNGSSSGPAYIPTNTVSSASCTSDTKVMSIRPPASVGPAQSVSGMSVTVITAIKNAKDSSNDTSSIAAMGPAMATATRAASAGNPMNQRKSSRQPDSQRPPIVARVEGLELRSSCYCHDCSATDLVSERSIYWHI